MIAVRAAKDAAVQQIRAQTPSSATTADKFMDGDLAALTFTNPISEDQEQESSEAEQEYVHGSTPELSGIDPATTAGGHGGKRPPPLVLAATRQSGSGSMDLAASRSTGIAATALDSSGRSIDTE